eukprot:scaffold1815_cov120-Isochrysis_galbana.AAC.1
MECLAHGPATVAQVPNSKLPKSHAPCAVLIRYPTSIYEARLRRKAPSCSLLAMGNGPGVVCHNHNHYAQELVPAAVLSPQPL